MRINTIRDISSFRLFRTSLRKAFENYQSPGVILDVLLSWGTDRFMSVTVNEEPRTKGKSNYNFAALVSQALLILTGFSTIPLRFATLAGFLIRPVWFCNFLYVLIATLTPGASLVFLSSPPS